MESERKIFDNFKDIILKNKSLNFVKNKTMKIKFYIIDSKFEQIFNIELTKIEKYVVSLWYFQV